MAPRLEPEHGHLSLAAASFGRILDDLLLISSGTRPDNPRCGAVGASLKCTMRPLDFSIVGVGVRVVLGSDGTCSEARIGL
jgi:hypothetical protein